MESASLVLFLSASFALLGWLSLFSGVDGLTVGALSESTWPASGALSVPESGVTSDLVSSTSGSSASLAGLLVSAAWVESGLAASGAAALSTEGLAWFGSVACGCSATAGTWSATGVSVDDWLALESPCLSGTVGVSISAGWTERLPAGTIGVSEDWSVAAGSTGLVDSGVEVLFVGAWSALSAAWPWLVGRSATGVTEVLAGLTWELGCVWAVGSFNSGCSEFSWVAGVSFEAGVWFASGWLWLAACSWLAGSGLTARSAAWFASGASTLAGSAVAGVTSASGSVAGDSAWLIACPCSAGAAWSWAGSEVCSFASAAGWLVSFSATLSSLDWAAGVWAWSASGADSWSALEM